SSGGSPRGYLEVDNPAGWFLDPGASQALTFNGGNGSAILLATQGNLTINARVNVVTDTRIDTNANSVTLTNGLSIAGKFVTKAGSGTLSIGGTQSNAAASSIALDTGALILNANVGTGLAGTNRPNLYVSVPTAAATATFNTTQY